MGNNNIEFSLRKDLFRLIIPIFIEQLLVIIAETITSIMVAGMGEAQISAISIIGSVNVLINYIFSALATGGSIIVGQYLGRKNEKKAGMGIEQTVTMAAVLSIVTMALVFLCKNFILDVIFKSISPEVRNHANIYLFILALSIPFMALYVCGAAIIRVMGNPKKAMITSIAKNFINIIGNALLIYYFNMGVAGAAISILISNILGAFIIINSISKESKTIHFKKEFKFSVDFHYIGKILMLAIPNGIENCMFQIGKIILMSLVTSFGTSSIVANSVGLTIQSFQQLPGNAIALVLLILVSKEVGAGNYKQIRFYTKKLLIIAFVTMLAINLLSIMLLPVIVDIYNLSEVAGELTKRIIFYGAISNIVIWPLGFVLPNTLRAANDVRYCMIVSVFSMWILRVGSSYILCKYLSIGVLGIWVAMSMDWIFRSILFVQRYRGDKWQLLNFK